MTPITVKYIPDIKKLIMREILKASYLKSFVAF